MFRKGVLLCACLAALAAGCEKKQLTTPTKATKEGPQAPAGMVMVRQRPPLFVSEAPVTVAQYVQFLRATGQDVPEKWQALDAASAEAQQPVTGLSTREASDYAVWNLKRLPTAEEWARVAAIVGQGPYPWQPGATFVSAPLFLVQDWTPGSEGERAAQAARSALADAILAARRADIQALRDALAAELKNQQEQRKKAQETLRTRFFTRLDEHKSLCEQRALRKWRQEALDVMRNIAVEKGTLAIDLKLASMGEAETTRSVEKFEQFLRESLNKVRQISQQLQAAAASAQDRVVALTRRIEEAASEALPEAFAQAQPLADATAPLPSTIEEAVTLKERMRQALAALKEAGAELARLPAAEEVEKEIAQLKKELQQLPAEADLTAQIQDIRARIERFGAAMGREFLDEKLLLNELEDLAQLRARRDAVEARLRLLERAVPQGAAR